MAGTCTHAGQLALIPPSLHPSSKAFTVPPNWYNAPPTQSLVLFLRASNWSLVRQPSWNYSPTTCPVPSTTGTLAPSFRPSKSQRIISLVPTTKRTFLLSHSGTLRPSHIPNKGPATPTVQYPKTAGLTWVFHGDRVYPTQTESPVSLYL